MILQHRSDHDGDQRHARRIAAALKPHLQARRIRAPGDEARPLKGGKAYAGQERHQREALAVRLLVPPDAAGVPNARSREPVAMPGTETVTRYGSFIRAEGSIAKFAEAPAMPVKKTISPA